MNTKVQRVCQSKIGSARIAAIRLTAVVRTVVKHQPERTSRVAELSIKIIVRHPTLDVVQMAHQPLWARTMRVAVRFATPRSTDVAKTTQHQLMVPIKRVVVSRQPSDVARTVSLQLVEPISSDVDVNGLDSDAARTTQQRLVATTTRVVVVSTHHTVAVRTDSPQRMVRTSRVAPATLINSAAAPMASLSLKDLTDKAADVNTQSSNVARTIEHPLADRTLPDVLADPPNSDAAWMAWRKLRAKTLKVVSASRATLERPAVWHAIVDPAGTLPLNGSSTPNTADVRDSGTVAAMAMTIVSRPKKSVKKFVSHRPLKKPAIYPKSQAAVKATIRNGITTPRGNNVDNSSTEDALAMPTGSRRAKSARDSVRHPKVLVSAIRI